MFMTSQISITSTFLHCRDCTLGYHLGFAVQSTATVRLVGTMIAIALLVMVHTYGTDVQATYQPSYWRGRCAYQTY